MTETLPEGLLLAAYGDDFTGSSAILEVLTFAGLPSALFLDLPRPDQLARFSGLRGIVVAGTARSHGPDWMDAHLPRIFDGLARMGAPLIHYKVCSTLDSAPHMGSIGRATEIALRQLETPLVPVLLAAPAIRRYQCFGHLFAAAPGGVFRLDRHPVMACHPVTPMHESDVAAHLRLQTELPIAVLDLEALQNNPAAELETLKRQGARMVCLDTLDEAHLARCGQLVWGMRGNGAFCVGSQGIEYALVAHWRAIGALPDIDPPSGIGRSAGMMTVSGSVSPVTEAQIDWASAHGFEAIALDPATLLDDASGQAENAVVAACLDAVSRGADPLVHTAHGPADPSIARLAQMRARIGMDEETANGRIGAALGRVLAQVIRKARLSRAVISGGDTSGHATRQCDIFALTALAPTTPGAAILRAWSEHPAFDGLELALKGGQMGSVDYFGRIRDGGA
ncbi:MAG: four-carbon acid sugar kinase family protein [Natronohydrobacter sp.]|nr:four-carbon acid sugar kinase family protein [Natronohydrobacter sp.]